MKQELHSRDLVVQKMSRDGLTEVNVTQETQKRISSKTAEHSYDKERAEQKFKISGSIEEQSSRYERQKKGAGRKTSRAEQNVARAEHNLSKRKSKAFKRYQKTPKQFKIRFDNSLESECEKSGELRITQNHSINFHAIQRNKKKLEFRDFFSIEIKPYRYKRPLVRQRIAKGIEKKFFEYENDNLGLEATHHGYRFGRQKYRKYRKKVVTFTSKQSRLERAKIKVQKAENKLSYYKFLQKNPQATPAEKNKEYQKRFNKKQYQKKYNKGAAQVHKSGQAMNAAKVAAEKLSEFVMANIHNIINICIVLCIIMFLTAAISAMASLLANIGTAILAGTYQAEYNDMTDCSGYFKQLEAELENRINHIKEEFPGYDEYQYDLGEIGHNATELLSYLGAKFIDFTLENSQSELDSIFEEMYHLILEEEIQIRTRKEMVWDDIKGEYVEKEVQYEYKILHIVLQTKPLNEILESRLTEDQKKQYDLYKETGGGQQVFGNPLMLDWHSSITSEFGYRVHPISGELKFHSGVDIAAPKGTGIHSCMSGTVVSAGWSDSYGWNVVIENERGLKTKYAHCSKLLVSAGDQVKTGETIAEVGSTGNSTGNHLHLEFIAADGQYLNPYFMATNYFKEDEDG